MPNADFLMEDSYLGNITDPLSLNRYNYTKSSPLNYIDPSGHAGAMSDPGNETSPHHSGTSGKNPSGNGSKPSYGAGMPQNATSPYSNETVCKEVSEFVKQNAGAGLVIGGAIQKGIDSAYIADVLQSKYGINVAEYANIDVSTMPEEARNCVNALKKTTKTCRII